MKITVSAAGKFHIFELIKQINKNNMLDKFITSYPHFYIKKHLNIPKNKIESKTLKEVIQRGWDKIPKIFKYHIDPQYLVSDLFDRSAAKCIDPTDIFVGLSSFSSRSIKKAKSLGSKTVLERGSSHILHQKKLLEEEFGLWNLKPGPFQLPHPKIVEKELIEYEESDYISIASSFVRRSFIDRGIPSDKLIQIPYGVDLSKFKQSQKEDKIFRIIFGGGITLRKGVQYLLEAFETLNLKDSELLLIGPVDQGMEDILNKFKKYKRIDYLPVAELYKVLSQGSVFVLPSIEEGLAMVQAMAMACGLPVIASTNTGGEDIIRDGKDGFIIPIRDVEKLKEKILFMYENQDKCAEMGRSAKEHVSLGFTWDDYGAKMIHQYKTIINV